MMSDKLRAAAQAVLYAMESSRVFITSREQIKQPEGTDWYDNIINNLEDALAEPAIKESLTVAEPEEKLLSIHRLDQWLKAALAEQKPMLEMNPQKREWVGLTDEERRGLREWQKIQEELGPVWAPMMLYLYEAIEAKLKEKNT